MASTPLQDDIEYPYSDRQPMAESDLHRDEMADLIAALQRRYRDSSDVYVSGNLFLYYREGDPVAVVAPDVFLVRGVPNHRRKKYKLWEEGRVPSLIIEVTSDTTRDEDLERKKDTYEFLGVEEYFLHDPEGDYLDPRLQGYRFSDDGYESMHPNPDGTLESRTTGLTLRIEGKNLRLIDTVTGERLPWVNELGHQLRELEGQLRDIGGRLAEETASLKALEEERARLDSGIPPSRNGV